MIPPRFGLPHRDRWSHGVLEDVATWPAIPEELEASSPLP
jgi:hypothetical protein